MSPSVTDDLYHYTSASVGLDAIVAGMRLRLGLLEDTNDPREARPRHPSLSVDEELDGDAAQKVWVEADRLLRRRAKLACFTLDYELPANSLDFDVLRGWNHPALWAHYGAQHSGVCLKFSRQRLDVAIREQLSDKGQLFSGEVVYYASHRQGTVLEPLYMSQIKAFGLDAVAEHYIDQHHHTLFFEKHLDWSREYEYRWVLVDENPLPVHIDVSGCLTGIVLGDAFPESRFQSARLLADRAGISLTHVRFLNGLPVRLPGPTSEVDAPSTAQRAGDLRQRVSALAAAQADAETREREAEVFAAQALGDLAAGIERLGVVVAERPAVRTSVMRSARAVPLELRQRAPGTESAESRVEHEAGSFLVAEHQPQYTYTFVAAVALQVVADGTVRLHGMMEVEQWEASGNQRHDLWRSAHTGKRDDLVALVDTVLAELDEAFPTAAKDFDDMRGAA